MRAVASAAAILIAALSLIRPAAAEDAPAPPPRPSLRPSALFAQHLYEGDFSEPRGLFYDRSRRELWVADTRNDLIGVFTPDGVPLFAFGEKDQLHEPARVAVDRQGRILVLDNDRSAVKLFSYRGEYISNLDLPGLPTPRVLSEIALDPAGFLYVGEGSECRVHVYDAQLKETLRFGACGSGEGEFQSIAGIAADADHIVVVDHQVTPVQVFDRKGNFLRGWGRHDMGVQNFSLPEAVALDAHGRVIVIDQLRHEIKFFDLEGNFLDRFGGLGSGPGQVSYPSDVAVDELDRVYVVERGNGRVQVFAGSGASAPVSPAGNAR